MQTDIEHLTATYRNGVRVLRAPKTAQLKPRKIEIAET